MRVEVWDVGTRPELRPLEMRPALTGGVIFSPNGGRVADIENLRVRIWDAATGARLGTVRGRFRADQLMREDNSESLETERTVILRSVQQSTELEPRLP